MFYDRGAVVFTTTGDQRVWLLDTRQQRLSVLYDARAGDDPPLTQVDNVTAHPRSGDFYVAEDPGNLELCVITPPTAGAPGVVASFLRVAGPADSELTGPAFDPAGGLNPGKVLPTLQRCAEYGKMHVRQGRLAFPEIERF